jgi:AcrR family transcriptional regulator
MNATNTEAGAPARTTRTQKRVMRTRHRLLTTALKLCAAQGIDATSIEQITEEADLGKGTFYRHFQSKQAMLVALAEETVSKLVQSMAGAKGAAKTLDQALEDLLHLHMTFFDAHADEYLVLFQSRLMVRLERNANQDLEQAYMRYVQALAEWLAPQGIERIDEPMLRRIACALSSFYGGTRALTMLGMSARDIERVYNDARQAFVRTLKNLLSSSSTPGAPRPEPPTPLKEEQRNAHAAAG